MKRLVSLIILSSFSQFGCGAIEQKAIVQNITNSKKETISQTNTSNNSETKLGYVADEKTAIDIAVKAWIPIYGKEKIENERPYRAKLKNGIWTVTSSLPEGYDGGVAEAIISQKDGQVLKITHGQ